MEKLIMELGERRKICINVFSKKNEAFEMQAAHVQLMYLENNVLTTESECEIQIDDKNIYTEIQPLQAGVYVIQANFDVADETIIKKFEMIVND